jgi:hypothetical protein
MSKKWSRKIVVRHIKTRHRKGKKLNSYYIQRRCKPLYMAAVQQFGGWKKAIKAAGIRYDDVRVKQRKRLWSKEKVIAIIRRRYELGQPLNSNYIQKKKIPLYGAACTYFGGWAEAVTNAGFNYSELRNRAPVRSWSKTAIVSEILRRHQQGLSIKGGDVYEQDRGLYWAAKHHFGISGWAKARILAGFTPIDPAPWKKWNKDILREEILRLHESGVALNTASLQKSPYAYIMSSATKIFGTWAKAIRAAGLNYAKIKKVRISWWTKPRIVMCIRSLEKRGVRLSSKAIQRSHCALFGTAVRLFGCWSQAVEASGISYQAHCRIWSTKAWLRKMKNHEYNLTLERAKTYATKRNNS